MGLVRVVLLGLACCAVLAVIAVAAVLIFVFIRDRDKGDRD